jgi:hypothetical protein
MEPPILPAFSRVSQHHQWQRKRDDTKEKPDLRGFAANPDR